MVVKGSLWNCWCQYMSWWVYTCQKLYGYNSTFALNDLRISVGMTELNAIWTDQFTFSCTDNAIPLIFIERTSIITFSQTFWQSLKMQAQLIYFHSLFWHVYNFSVQPLHHTNPLEFSNYKSCSCPMQHVPRIPPRTGPLLIKLENMEFMSPALHNRYAIQWIQMGW